VAEQYVLVSLEFTHEDQSKSRTEATKVALYDETDPNAGYKRCVRWPDLVSPTGEKDADNHLKLRSWVYKFVTGAFLDGDPKALDLGKSGKVGLTSDADGTGTKTLEVLTDAAVPQITLAQLKQMGA